MSNTWFRLRRGFFLSFFPSDTPHYENVPFEIPSSWVWTTGNEIFSPLRSCIPQGDTFIYVDIDAIDNKVNIINNPKIMRTADAPSRATRYTKAGDVLFSMVRPYLRNIAIVPENGWIASTGFYVCSPSKLLLSQYCYYLMLSDYVVDGLNQYMKGDNSPSINNSHILSWLYPIPPLTEQQRIVKEIERWFASIDEIEQDKSDLQTIIKQAKSKILDLAIHGKLVPQDPNDEPAIELLKRINPNFTPCDNGHSEKLPQNWCWVKGKFIFSPMKSVRPTGRTFQYIDIDSIDNARQTVKEIKVIKTNNAPSRASRYTQEGDIIFSMVRPYLRNIAKININDCIASTGFYVCSPLDMLHSEYCYYLMISNYVICGLNQFMKGDNSPSINKGDIDNWLFPLPPLAEQQRIVAKIEELFSILDDIQKSLEA